MSKTHHWFCETCDGPDTIFSTPMEWEEMADHLMAVHGMDTKVNTYGVWTRGEYNYGDEDGGGYILRLAYDIHPTVAIIEHYSFCPPCGDYYGGEAADE